ncbi:MAG TPA: type II secretion system protein [Verrucomicrobiae bacterium]|nr:type II secretion system protein [Verrucomicrobiae bacterium]
MKALHPLTKPRRPRAAFTLVELLVVIAIIGVLAALITGLASRASKSKIVKRAEVENEALVMAIEVYKSKLGYYPQDNSNNLAMPPLYHELTGIAIPTAYLSDFGVAGIANINSDAGTNSVPQNFLSGLKSSQYEQILNKPGAYRLIYAYGKVPWSYNSTNPTNNPGSFDLWVELEIAGKKEIVGNWKN